MLRLIRNRRIYSTKTLSYSLRKMLSFRPPKSQHYLSTKILNIILTVATVAALPDVSFFPVFQASSLETN